MFRRVALVLPRDQAVGTSSSTVNYCVRTYATAKGSAAGQKKASAGSGGKPSKGNRGQETQADARIESIKKVTTQRASQGLIASLIVLIHSGLICLSSQNLYESTPSDADRLAALAKVVPSPEAHETIQRAWALHQRHKREAHSAELARKYESMRKAIDLLEKTDKVLWEKAVEGKKFQNVDQSGATNARLVGLVPRELRPPMEVPGSRMWDHDWSA